MEGGIEEQGRDGQGREVGAGRGRGRGRGREGGQVRGWKLERRERRDGVRDRRKED